VLPPDEFHGIIPEPFANKVTQAQTLQQIQTTKSNTSPRR